MSGAPTNREKEAEQTAGSLKLRETGRETGKPITTWGKNSHLTDDSYSPLSLRNKN